MSKARSNRPARPGGVTRDAGSNALRARLDLRVLLGSGRGEPEALLRGMMDKRRAVDAESPSTMSLRLETARLVLRPLTPGDAPVVARLAGRREIADTTISIPHPYSEQTARDWIAARTGPDSVGKESVFAITIKGDGLFIGAIGLREIDTQHSQAEMGFWVGVENWGNGYATEAGRAVVQFAFEQLRLNRVYAHHMVRNPASGRVLEKIGLKQEGILRQRVRKWGVFEDVVVLAILRADWPDVGGTIAMPVK